MENWDEAIIKTDFMKDIISRLVHKVLKKKVGHDVEIKVNELAITDRDEKFHVHLNVDAEISMKELEEMLKDTVEF